MKKVVAKCIQIYQSAAINEKIALIIIFVWVIVAVLDPWIANDTSWSLIRYQYDTLLGSQGSLLPPLSCTDGNIHLLGTDTLGRDVAAGMIHGARVSLIISIVVVSLALAIGVFVGMLMGYFGDTGIRINLLQTIWLLFCMIIFTYYKTDILFNGWSWWSSSITIIFTLLFFWLLYCFDKLPLKKYAFPIDMIWQRVFELQESIPNLFFLLALTAIIVEPSIWTLSLTLIVLMWVTFARHARAQMMTIKDEEYMLSARASGMSTWRLILVHALPNVLGPILVVSAFSMSSVILVEATLSFLGLGLPLENVTWGKILAESRKDISAWWLAVFPGLAIFALIFAFNTIADMIRENNS